MVIHTSSSSIQREKKLHLHHSQRERTRTTQKQTLNTTKRPPPPNKVIVGRCTTKEHSRVFFERESQRERRVEHVLAPQKSFRREKFYLFFTKKSNKKGRGETSRFLIVLHAAKGVSSHTKHIRALINEHTNMNTAPPSSCSSKNYVSIDDMESATLLPKSKDDSMIGKKNPSSNTHVSLKNVAYGLGIVALACSGSFVAGQSAARYKLSSSASSSSQLGVARLGGGSKASVKHSTAHRAAAAKKAKTAVANVGKKEEDKASSVEETQPADPDTMSKEEMAEEIKQLRGYMTSLVGDDDREVYNVSFLFPLLGDLSPLEFSSSRRRGIEGGETFLFDDDSSIIFVCLLLITHANRLFSLFF